MKYLDVRWVHWGVAHSQKNRECANCKYRLWNDWAFNIRQSWQHFLGSESCFTAVMAVQKECATPPHVHPTSRYVTAHDQFTRPSSMLHCKHQMLGWEGLGTRLQCLFDNLDAHLRSPVTTTHSAASTYYLFTWPGTKQGLIPRLHSSLEMRLDHHQPSSRTVSVHQSRYQRCHAKPSLHSHCLHTPPAFRSNTHATPEWVNSINHAWTDPFLRLCSQGEV